MRIALKFTILFLNVLCYELLLGQDTLRVNYCKDTLYIFQQLVPRIDTVEDGYHFKSSGISRKEFEATKKNDGLNLDIDEATLKDDSSFVEAKEHAGRYKPHTYVYIKLKNNKVKKYKSNRYLTANELEQNDYNYVKSFKNKQYSVILSSGYEWYSMLLLDRNTGRDTAIAWGTNIILSQDSSLLLIREYTGMFDGINRYSLYKIGEKHLYKIWSLNLPLDFQQSIFTSWITSYIPEIRFAEDVIYLKNTNRVQLHNEDKENYSINLEKIYPTYYKIEYRKKENR